MGNKVKAVQKNKNEEGQLEVFLHDPGMTLLHRVGLAGLWMTLEQLEKENGGRAELGKGTWSRSPSGVTIRWQGDGVDFFQELFKRSFKIDDNGLVWLAALGEPSLNPEAAIVLNEALLGTFLQHGKTRKADNSSKPTGRLSCTFDDISYVLQYHRFTKYSHQDQPFSPEKANALAGWLCPGGAVRHSGFGQKTALEEEPSRALALRYAPVGVIYFEIRSRRPGIRPKYAFVIPCIKNLERYAAVRSVFIKQGVSVLYASGTADAGYRVLTEMHSAGLLADMDLASCRVISFGTVPWSTQQKTRVELATVHAANSPAIEVYKRCRHALPNRPVKPNDKDPFWDIPQVPDMVALNLSNGQPWWNGFSDFVADKSVRDHVFNYEKGGLADMVSDETVMPPGPEKTIIEACHEAWRRRMGRIGEKARREGSSFPDQIRREFEKTRVEFARCKNAAALRQTLTDFWARGGPLPPLQEGWRDVLPLLDDLHWRKARDLALLALASYKPASKQEEEALKGQEGDVEEDYDE